LSLLAFSGCGLFYQYGPEEDSLKPEIAELEEGLYMVPEVVDGDTIILSNGDHIRLLGINTPEIGMYFYQESKEVLEIIVLDRQVSLEKDISDRDIYGRKLRYLFQGDIFVNLEMVKRGFANIYTCPPDVRYSEELLAAERYARENDLGLWESSDLNTIGLEVFYDAPGNDNENINGEYVILDNTGETTLDTEGWTIKDSGTNMYTFDSYEFLPGSMIILFSGRGKDGDGMFYWNSPTPIWNNDFDTLYLRDKQGLLIEIYNY
jgi:micrococcal nuclease